MQAIVWYFRDRIPWESRPSVVVVAMMLANTLVLGAFSLLSFGADSFFPVSIACGILCGLVSFVYSVLTISHVRFYYLARGSRNYRLACHALERMDRLVRSGLIAKYSPDDYFRAARESAAEVMMNRWMFPQRRGFYGRPRKTWAVRKYEEFIDVELKRIVEQMPLTQRPHFAVEVCGYYDAKNLREHVLHDANVLHCTRIQLLQLLTGAVSSDFGQTELLNLVRLIVRDARNMEFFDESAGSDGQMEMTKCEFDTCYELYVATQTLLKISTPWGLTRSDLQCLIAFERNRLDMHESHWKMAQDENRSTKLHRALDEAAKDV